MNVKPQTADMHNALTYDFDQVKPDSTVVELEWEKVAVPFKVAVDVHPVVEASLQKQLRNLRSTPGSAGMKPRTICSRRRPITICADL